jgi:transcriptional regulator with XRE-family HTH domain
MRMRKPSPASEPLNRALGERLRCLRLRRGMVRRDVAQFLGWRSQAAWGNVEAGRARLLVVDLTRVAGLFGTTASRLLRGL